MTFDVTQHVAAAEAQLDQLVESQRALRTQPGVADMSREEYLSTLIGTMLLKPPQDFDEFASLAAVAILAVERLARLPRPQIGP